MQSQIQKLIALLPKTQSIPPPTIKTLMAANLHLGHHKSLWNQSMLQYIYGHYKDQHIINLDSTLTCLRRATKVVEGVARVGGKVLFVGTRPALHAITTSIAESSHAFFVIHWNGGTITNKERVLRRSVGYDPDVVSQSLKSQSMETSEDQSDYKEIIGKQPFVHTPDLIILLDYRNTGWAAYEANLMGVPVIAICDTDCDPTRVQYPIPGNDDSITGVELIARVLGESCRQGYQSYLAQ